MRPKGPYPTIVAVAALLAGCSRPQADPAAPARRSGALTELVNRVEARTAADVEWAAARLGQSLVTGNAVQTYSESSARVDMDDGAIVRLAPMTLFTVTGLDGNVDAP